MDVVERFLLCVCGTKNYLEDETDSAHDPEQSLPDNGRYRRQDDYY